MIMDIHYIFRYSGINNNVTDHGMIQQLLQSARDIDSQETEEDR
jgi:hypothetical protein